MYFDHVHLRARRGEPARLVLVAVERKTAMKFVVMLEDRLGSNPNTLALVVQGLRELGLSGLPLVLRGDGDSSLMDLLTRVADMRGARTVLAEQSSGQSSSRPR